MSRSHLQSTITFTTTWLGVIAIAFSLRILLGTDVALTETLGWLVLACVPPMVALHRFRGLPGQAAPVVVRASTRIDSSRVDRMRRDA